MHALSQLGRIRFYSAIYSIIEVLYSFFIFIQKLTDCNRWPVSYTLYSYRLSISRVGGGRDVLFFGSAVKFVNLISHRLATFMQNVHWPKKIPTDPVHSKSRRFDWRRMPIVYSIPAVVAK